ncbi:MAG: pyridoxal phosphate-dependent aminotransferase [Hadesarchaea archaeon]|jgi:aspartate aminotransferase|nr:MAG: pyridoxal phosphate-dependent aminotransferase [Hadesarchaea archaeon]
MREIPPSSTLRVLSLAKRLEREGRRILHLEVGEPDFDTPEHVKRAAWEALQRGMTKYTPSEGLPELREAVAERVGAERENVLITPGAKHAIFCAMEAILDPGDEVILPSPCWTYDGIVLSAGGKPVFLETRMEEGFRVDPERVEEKLTPRTRLLVLNSPCNPTGAVLERENLRALLELARERDLWILTDEIYDRLVYEGESPSLLSLSGSLEGIVYINGFSKTYAMTGWRLGYAVAPRELVAEMNKIQQASTSCVPGFVQVAGLEALRGPQDFVERMREEFRRRRDFLVRGLSSLGLRCLPPRGAFYAFPRLPEGWGDSTRFCELLLEEAGIASVPGAGFGPFGEGHVRFSFACSLEVLRETLEGLRGFLEAHRGG